MEKKDEEIKHHTQEKSISIGNLPTYLKRKQGQSETTVQLNCEGIISYLVGKIPLPMGLI